MNNIAPRPACRPAFTLLEVLISIFILGTGILSVFSLFMAGRSLQAYYHRQNAAKSYVDSTARSLSNKWVRSDLVRVDTNGKWLDQNNDPLPFPPTTSPEDEQFEPNVYLIDPVGLNLAVPGSSGVNKSWGTTEENKWNIAFAGDFSDPESKLKAIARVGLDPLTDAETSVNELAGGDDLAYELSNPASPDTAFLIRSYDGGRQRRNSNYHHALLMTDSVADNAILVFKDRPVPISGFAALENDWPLGMCMVKQDKPANIIGSITAIEEGTLENAGAKETARKCLRPKQWAIIRGRADNSFRFARVMSVIEDDSDTYTLVFAENMEGDAQFGNVINTSAGVECYFWSSLVHIAPYTRP